MYAGKQKRDKEVHLIHIHIVVMKVPLICFWVLIPPRLGVCQSEWEKQREEDKCDSEVSKCVFWSEAYRSSCLGPGLCVDPHTDDAWGWTCHMCLSVDLRIWLTVCMCVCAKGTCVWKAVPEGSRQSKGVNSWSMARIHRSPSSISWLTWNWGEEDRHCCYSCCFNLFSISSFCFKPIKGSHFIFQLVSNPSLSPASGNIIPPETSRLNRKSNMRTKHEDTKVGSLEAETTECLAFLDWNDIND